MYKCEKIYKRNNAMLVDVVVNSNDVNIPSDIYEGDVYIPVIVYADKYNMPVGQRMFPKKETVNGQKLDYGYRFMSFLCTNGDVATDIEASAVCYAEQQGYLVRDEHDSWHENK